MKIVYNCLSTHPAGLNFTRAFATPVQIKPRGSRDMTTCTRLPFPLHYVCTHISIYELKRITPSASYSIYSSRVRFVGKKIYISVSNGFFGQRRYNTRRVRIRR